MYIDENKILEIISNPALTHEQATNNLAALVTAKGERIKPSASFDKLLKKGMVCEQNETRLLYAPRYILPDYEMLMQEGCDFLRLPPPQDLRQAVECLKIFYRYIPSVTHYPVYLGSVDKLLEPFIDNEINARQIIKEFLFSISRLIPDSYCHMNIGPEPTNAGRYILDAEIEMQQASPSITMLYDSDITPDDYAQQAVTCALLCAKPSFANHKIYSSEHDKAYGIASCYNALRVGGGSFSLSRIMLNGVAENSANVDSFFHELLPETMQNLCEFMEEKVQFLVEESHFFKSNFLVEEGFVRLDDFTSMIGVVGLNECVNILQRKQGKEGRYGHDEEADKLGHEILQAVSEHLNQFTSKYCAATGHRFVLHGQVGINSDINISPAARIAIGDEPPLHDHLRHAASFHSYFPSGTGDIFPFDRTANENPTAVVDLIKGAFSLGMRYFSTYSNDGDVVRITGYLVKKSDMKKLANDQAVLQANAIWGLGEVRNSRVLDRKERSL